MYISIYPFYVAINKDHGAIFTFINTDTMKAKIKTRSNYRNLNGQWLKVVEIVGTRVSCLVETEDMGTQTVDFSLKEVEMMAYKSNVPCTP